MWYRSCVPVGALCIFATRILLLVLLVVMLVWFGLVWFWCSCRRCANCSIFLSITLGVCLGFLTAIFSECVCVCVSVFISISFTCPGPSVAVLPCILSLTLSLPAMWPFCTFSWCVCYSRFISFSFAFSCSQLRFVFVFFLVFVFLLFVARLFCRAERCSRTRVWAGKSATTEREREWARVRTLSIEIKMFINLLSSSNCSSIPTVSS